MKELRFTLYDFFGYLLPGAIALFAILITGWGELCHRLNFDAIVGLPRTEIGLLVLIAYFLGHLMQALGNLFEEQISLRICDVRARRKWTRLPMWSVRLFSWSLAVDRYSDVLDSLPAPVSKRFYEAFVARFGLDGQALRGTKEIYKLCDEALLREGSVEEREIQSYREGFYRGTFVALILTSAAMIFLHPKMEIIVHSEHFNSSSGYFYWVIALSLVCAVLSFHRYRKFRKLRIRNCFARFVASMTALEVKASEAVPALRAKAKSA
jgi:hypothetical protein